MSGNADDSRSNSIVWERCGTLGMGAASLGNLFVEMDEACAVATVEQAIASGIRLFDVAPLYGRGIAEHRLGRALAGRSDALISTKVGAVLRPLRPGERAGASIFAAAPPLRPDYGYDGESILRSLDDSAERLGREPDIVLVHDLSRAAHGDAYPAHFDAFLESGLPALQAAKRNGRIKAIGAGLNHCEDALALMDAAALDVLLLAGRYTLLDQSALDAVLPRCAAQGVRFIAGGPYNSGILALGSGSDAARHDYRPADDQIRARVARIEAIATAFDVPIATAALRFALGHPAVTMVLPGLASPAEVSAATSAMETPIDDGFWVALQQQGLLRPDVPLPAAELEGAHL